MNDISTPEPGALVIVLMGEEQRERLENEFWRDSLEHRLGTVRSCADALAVTAEV